MGSYLKTQRCLMENSETHPGSDKPCSSGSVSPWGPHCPQTAHSGADPLLCTAIRHGVLLNPMKAHRTTQIQLVSPVPCHKYHWFTFTRLYGQRPHHSCQQQHRPTKHPTHFFPSYCTFGEHVHNQAFGLSAFYPKGMPYPQLGT